LARRDGRSQLGQDHHGQPAAGPRVHDHIEHARHYIDLQRITGRSTAEVRARQSEFQRAVVDMQIEQERSLDPQQTVFLDRALPDSLAYYRFLGLAPGTALLGALAGARYATVFLLDLLPLASDYARTEDPAAQRRIHDLLGLVYQELGFPVVTVPALAPDARVDFILERASAGTPAERGVS
jgi:predicted ATPase